MTQFHFHEFQLPKGAVRLAKTDIYPNQAFSYGDKIFGLQFHPEVTRTGLDRWQSWDEENFQKPGAQSREMQNELAAEHEPAMDIWFRGFLNKLFGPA